jgi:hypothetical protein
MARGDEVIALVVLVDAVEVEVIVGVVRRVARKRAEIIGVLREEMVRGAPFE